MIADALRDCAIIASVTAVILAFAHVVPVAKNDAARPPHRLVVRNGESALPLPDSHALRVCADPNNLPFSNSHLDGFENAIADLLARDLGKHVTYYWQPQRRGFIRTTLNAGACDVVIGVPAHFDLVATTRPYYRSTYVFVVRRGRGRLVRALDDPRLRRWRIGVEMTGEDAENPPAVQALATRHLVDNMRGYLVYGDYSKPNPPRRVIDAVARGEVDVAIAWGPLAGYFAIHEPVPLAWTPVRPENDGPGLRFAFSIAMAVRRGDRGLHDALDAALVRRRAEIDRILERYGVPLLPLRGQS